MGGIFWKMFCLLFCIRMCWQVLSELSAAYASLVDVREMSGSATFNNRDAERVHMLSGQWAKSMTHMFERNR